MFRRLWVVVLLVFSVGLHAQDLKIAAAADLQPVLPALIEQFEKQSHQKVDASYASSATLATQILNGGPFGLFLSADLSFPQKVVAAGLADSGAPIPYARGTLVLWARNDSPIQPLSLDSLRSRDAEDPRGRQCRTRSLRPRGEGCAREAGADGCAEKQAGGGGEYRADRAVRRFRQRGCGVDFSYLGADAAVERGWEIRDRTRGFVSAAATGSSRPQARTREGGGPSIS